MAKAAASVLGSVGNLCPCTGSTPHGHLRTLASSLFTSWAPLFRSLDLDGDSLKAPGLSAFLERATSLQDLYLNCDGVLTAAHAAHILPSCSAQLVVHVAGSHMPHAWPSMVTRLHLCFDHPHDENRNPLPWDSEIPSAVLCTIVRLEHLKVLDLDFTCITEDMIQLACPLLAPLPQLEVRIHFQLRGHTQLDLSWLLQQPCAHLCVAISPVTTLPAQHKHVVECLQSLPAVHELDLTDFRFTPELQLIWSEVHIKERLTLDVIPIHLLSGARWPLLAFPSCPDIAVDVSTDHEVAVDWAAVTRHAGRISFHMGELNFRMLGGCALPSLQGPWQLTVHDALSVQGLQGAHVSGSVHYLRNAAAVSEGWTIESDRSSSRNF